MVYFSKEIFKTWLLLLLLLLVQESIHRRSSNDPYRAKDLFVVVGIYFFNGKGILKRNKKTKQRERCGQSNN